jgi:hypothetical protein
MCRRTGEEVGGTFLVGLYNRSGWSSLFSGLSLKVVRGLYELGALPIPEIGIDLGRVAMEKLDIETKTVWLTREFMEVMGYSLYRMNPQLAWLCILHSENGLITQRAIEGASGCYQEAFGEILHIYAQGPASALPKWMGKSVINVYSNRDYVTGFGLFGRANDYTNNPNYDVRVLPCISGFSDRNFWFADHGYLGPTYTKGRLNWMQQLEGKYPFYRGAHEIHR